MPTPFENELAPIDSQVLISQLANDAYSITASESVYNVLQARGVLDAHAQVNALQAKKGVQQRYTNRTYILIVFLACVAVMPYVLKNQIESSFSLIHPGILIAGILFIALPIIFSVYKGNKKIVTTILFALVVPTLLFILNTFVNEQALILAAIALSWFGALLINLIKSKSSD